MRAALDEAGARSESGDVPIGAVVLDAAGSVIGRGHNVRERDGDPTGHAELVALRGAAQAAGEWRLAGCTLVVTLEPCTMCAGAVVLVAPGPAGVRGVRRQGRGGRVALGRGPRPPPQPPSRGRRRRARRGVLGACWTISSPTNASGSLSGGGVSERPKENASKAFVGASPPRVQIPPPPPRRDPGTPDTPAA